MAHYNLLRGKAGGIWDQCKNADIPAADHANQQQSQTLGKYRSFEIVDFFKESPLTCQAAKFYMRYHIKSRKNTWF